jgi:NET1-associated nuclear protein 1 (U3 small nucleolar RNA-associated protein 17)
MEGTKLQRWEFESKINALAAISASPAENKPDIIFLVERKYKKWRIKLFGLTGDTKPSKTDNQTKVLYECQQQISNLKVLHDGRVVVATTGKCLVVGTAIGEATAGSYVWTELTSPDWLTCLDVQESSKEPILSKSREKLKMSGKSGPNPTIDIVVGDIKGTIFVHHDLLNRLIPDHQKGEPARLDRLARGASRRRHWHREAVHSVKWSLDGRVGTISLVDI